VLTNLSWAELQLDRAYEARRHALRSMETIERSGGAEHSGYGDAAVTLGRVALAEGKLEETATWARRALSSPARRTDATAGALQLLADIRRVRGDPEAAAEILALIAHRLPLAHATRREIAASLRELESELSPGDYAAAVARGEGRELEELVAEETTERGNA
jgi:hypothetical protein